MVKEGYVLLYRSPDSMMNPGAGYYIPCMSDPVGRSIMSIITRVKYYAETGDSSDRRLYEDALAVMLKVHNCIRWCLDQPYSETFTNEEFEIVPISRNPPIIAARDGIYIYDTKVLDNNNPELIPIVAKQFEYYIWEYVRTQWKCDRLPLY